MASLATYVPGDVAAMRRGISASNGRAAGAAGSTRLTLRRRGCHRNNRQGRRESRCYDLGTYHSSTFLNAPPGAAGIFRRYAARRREAAHGIERHRGIRRRIERPVRHVLDDLDEVLARAEGARDAQRVGGQHDGEERVDGDSPIRGPEAVGLHPHQRPRRVRRRTRRAARRDGRVRRAPGQRLRHPQRVLAEQARGQVHLGHPVDRRPSPPGRRGHPGRRRRATTRACLRRRSSGAPRLGGERRRGRDALRARSPRLRARARAPVRPHCLAFRIATPAAPPSGAPRPRPDAARSPALRVRRPSRSRANRTRRPGAAGGRGVCGRTAGILCFAQKASMGDQSSSAIPPTIA